MQINVLGLGNIMFGDEGFGVEAVRLLAESGPFPPEVQIVDGGTQGLYLLNFIEDPDCLLVFDALIPVHYNRQVYVYRQQELPAFIHRKMSSHQIGLSELFSLAKLNDKLPGEIALVGIPPATLEMQVGLSETAKILLPEAVAAGEKIIREWLARGDAPA